MSARAARLEAGAKCATLVELLDLRAAQGGDTGYRFLSNGDPEQRLSFAELDARARGLAMRLRERAEPGDRVILHYPAGLDFLVGLFASVRAGLIGVPTPSPRGRAVSPDEFAAVAAIIADCAPRLALTTGAVLAALPDDFRLMPGGPEWLATDRAWDGPAGTLETPSADALVYLQYTSGSTATPKGVMVSHRNVIANLAAIYDALAHPQDAVGVSWLPHYHDMGLTGGLLSALYGGFPFTFMPPADFLGNPMRWLKAMTESRATWSGGPNFAYELCCRRVRPRDLDELDLSAWKVAATGSEPVRRATVDRFCDIFARSGFRREAMSPYYGLAETVVFATGASAAEPPRMVAGRPLHDGAEAPKGWYAACGPVASGHSMAIVDPETGARVADGEPGEIWLAGPSVAGGYWGRDELNAEVFRARLDADPREWLRTGDSGFIADGDLVVTGRLKDLIIVAGANHLPQDIEATVETAHPAVRPGNVVAFAVGDVTDRLVIAAEVVGDLGGGAADDVIAAIRAAVAERHGVAAGAVTLLRGRVLPKTSSGKLKRNAAREAWLAGFRSVVAQWPADTGGGRETPHPAADAAGVERLRDALVRHVQRILRDPELAVDANVPFHHLGLGSLELAELKSAVEAEFPIEIPLARLLQGCCIADLLGTFGRAHPDPGPERAQRHRFETLVNPYVGELLRRFRLDQPFVRGEGSWLERADGTRVLDAIAGFGALPLGHNPEPLWRAIVDVRDRREPSLVQPSMNDAGGELAERLLEIAPPGLAHVTFTNSGAETTEAALKLTRAATGRRAFLSTRNGFHGKTLGALSVTGRASFQEPFGAPIFDVAYVPFGDVSALEAELRERGHLYAAFLVEPIQGEGGIVEPPAGYLAAAAALCAEHGVKLVVDEIQTGLGRTGSLFACGAERVVPDVLLLAKALGGGLISIGAMLYRADCYTEDFGRAHSSTFAGNSLACRTAIAMLDLLAAEDGGLVRAVAARGDRLRAALQGIAGRYPGALRSIRGRGYFLGLELVDQRHEFGRDSLLGVLAEQGGLSALVASYLLNVEHVRVAPTLLASSVIRIEPPLNFTDEEVDVLVAAVERAVEHLANRDTAALLNHLLERPRPIAPASPRRPPAAQPAAFPAPEAGLRRFAFLAHPIDATGYADLDPALAGFTLAELSELQGRLSGGIDPFVIGETRIEGEGAAIAGQFIVVPHTSARLAEASAQSLEAIREAAGMAREWGAEVVGLGGYVSIASSGGVDLAGAGVPLTTGNSFTAISGAQAVAAACSTLDVRLADATVGVVGAGGSVGQALSFLMAEQAGRLILVGNPAHREASLALLQRVAEATMEALLSARPAETGELAQLALDHHDRTGAAPDAVAAWLVQTGRLTLTVDIEAALAECEVVMTATSCPEPLIPPHALRHGAIVCELSQPRNLSPDLARLRPDVLAVDGGLVAVPKGADLGWSFGLPPGVAYACMCEPMILALEQQFTAAPQGVGVPLDYLRALRGWARKHGFRLAPLRSFGKLLDDGAWQRLLAARRGASSQDAPAPHLHIAGGNTFVAGAATPPPARDADI